MKNNTFKSLVFDNKSDLKNFSDDVKYLNINISDISISKIDELLASGTNFYYTDYFDGKANYIYTDFQKFHDGMLIIKRIVDNINKDFSKLELIRYLYISLGRVVFYDITSDLNISNSLKKVWEDNNIFCSLSSGVVNDYVLCKLFVLLCSLCNIDCEILKHGDRVKNKVLLDKDWFVVSLYDDLPFVYGSFKTKFFGKENDNLLVDKKIKYISDNYVSLLLDDCFKKSKDKSFEGFLCLIQLVVDFSSVPAVMLKSLLNILFDMYGFTEDTLIIDCYYNNKDNKDYFPLIYKDDKYFSYNYKNNTFMIVALKDIKYNIKVNNIGLYPSDKDFLEKESVA